jgi:hypothetical protein
MVVALECAREAARAGAASSPRALGVALGGLPFNEGVKLVLEPSDGVLTQVNVQWKFARILEATQVDAGEGDAPLFQSWIRHKPPPGGPAGSFRK